MTHSGTAAGRAAWTVGLLAGLMLALPALAVDTHWLRDVAEQRTAEYVRIDTTNPPGDTHAAVRFFADIFLKEGISFETVETAPGVESIWARLPAAGHSRRNPALLLLHPLDTPPAQPEQWERAPLSGEMTEDRIHGRGALGNKALGIIHLQAFLGLHRSGLPLNRDVVFMATADHRSGGEKGLGWLVRHVPDAFRDVGFVLAAGGHGVRSGNRTVFHVEVGHKAPLWLRLTSRAEDSDDASAVERLLDALQDIRGWTFPVEVTPPVAAYFAALAPLQSGVWEEGFADIVTAVQDESFLANLSATYPEYYDLLRNTCTIAAIHVGHGSAATPARAEARVECSLLMHQNPRQVVAALSAAVADHDVRIDTLLSHPSDASATATPVYRALSQALEESAANRHVVPAIGTGVSDNHFLREQGIAVYGITPVAATSAELTGITGADESVRRLELRRGTLLMYELLEALVHD